MFKNMPPDTNLAQFEQARTKGDMPKDINLQYTNRLDCPITLTPQNATFTDVEIHARIRQRLSPGTVQRRLRYARYMERHPPTVYRPTGEKLIDKTQKIALSNIQLLTKPFRSFFLLTQHGRSCLKWFYSEHPLNLLFSYTNSSEVFPYKPSASRYNGGAID